jgi:hypothetical protein
VELAHSTAPIILDPLAPYLGKAAWQTAFNDWYASADVTVLNMLLASAMMIRRLFDSSIAGAGWFDMRSAWRFTS